MALKDTCNTLASLLQEINQDLEKASEGNKAAAQRVRTLSIKFEKTAKLYRKESVQASKSGAMKRMKKTGKKAAPKKSAPKKAAPKKSASKKASPKKAAAKKAPKAKSAAKKSAGKKSVTRKGAGSARKATSHRKSAAKKRATAKLPSGMNK